MTPSGCLGDYNCYPQSAPNMFTVSSGRTDPDGSEAGRARLTPQPTTQCRARPAQSGRLSQQHRSGHPATQIGGYTPSLSGRCGHVLSPRRPGLGEVVTPESGLGPHWQSANRSAVGDDDGQFEAEHARAAAPAQRVPLARLCGGCRRNARTCWSVNGAPPDHPAPGA
jgi:hypothetical protein